MQRLTPQPSSSVFSHTSFWGSLRIHTPLFRSLHTTPSKPAIPLPTTTAGPPPQPPLPASSQNGQRVERRRLQAELLRRGQDLRASQMKPGSAMKKRFWKDVSVREAPGRICLSLWEVLWILMPALFRGLSRTA